MIKVKTLAGVERERERARATERDRVTTLINNKQAKRLALLSILKTGTKHKKCLVSLSFCVSYTS